MSSGQRSEGEVLLLGRPLEIFLGGCSCIEGGEFREILKGRSKLEVAGDSFGLEVKVERISGGDIFGGCF